MADSTLLLASIDDYLGPGENRFFSRGYQRAGYRVRDITVDPPDFSEPGVRARVDVEYPADWSRKGDVDQRPHLSTVDALVLGVQLTELHLAHGFGLSPADRARARLRKAVLRAGGEPQEDLTDIPLSTRLVRSEATTPSYSLSVYDCAVGSLRMRCEVEHPTGASRREPGNYDDLDDVLGDGGRRYYGEAFKSRRHHVRDVRVDLDTLDAQAEVHFSPEPDVADRGIGGRFQPSVTFVDAFVVNLQLVQVLLYELDSLSRATSNTLWMMQTVLEALAPPPPLPDRAEVALPASATLVGKRLLTLRGGTWRSVDIEARMAGIGIRCSFAHELPT
ncbi:AvrD family protein [Saccharothrix obliqua]|uniref:AvrD family protein n=1 Tax=Saccharothrix obliqua TaxID=2861747 RepID=UPI001C5D4B74|nr:AvrD family protein [Saccharothrix obliqua]MBW4721591.1 hypothetical protein [Saccharothrix obliqua]